MVRNFFDENTPIIFGIEFDEVSLIDLVQIDVVKEILVEVQNLKKELKLKKSLIRLGKAYWILIKNFKNKYPFIFSDYIGVDIPSSTERELIYIYERLGIILLDIDYRKYIKFNLLTSNYVSTSLFSFFGEVDERIYTKEQVNFCMNFVIDCTLKYLLGKGVTKSKIKKITKAFNESLEYLEIITPERTIDLNDEYIKLIRSDESIFNKDNLYRIITDIIIKTSEKDGIDDSTPEMIKDILTDIPFITMSGKTFLLRKDISGELEYYIVSKDLTDKEKKSLDDYVINIQKKRE